MSVLYLLLPLALVIAGAAVGVYVWAVRSGQLDDLETPPRRILLDDAAPRDLAPPGAPAASSPKPPPKEPP